MKQPRKAKRQKPQPKPLPDQVPVILRELRAREDLSQNAAAIKCDVAQSLWCRWESGKRLPSLATFQQIGDAFGVTITLSFGR